ncbi:hypothetical protein [Ramlibacter sp. Leaf400]|uniref:hypothetical protein n=1 Tax=Ramlibacter sp. Leaf400 TaxID=1736365 RepID=UPI0006F330C2|nr:hypothetical protein [Ramlibacter sp. Leaf400]KQT10966.1 hypothetical protein ASG30_09210 [Ramlibacter sp. Leaf400]
MANKKTVIRAEPGKPWPNPPAGGSWIRDTTTGDLTLDVPPASDTDADRQKRRAEQRAAALARGEQQASAEQVQPDAAPSGSEE